MRKRHSKRVLALDVGTRRIGVAISDELGLLARPLTVLDSRRTNVLEELQKIFATYDIGTVVLGLPKNMDGTEGQQARQVRAFGKRLEEIATGIEMEYWDERLSTKQAADISILTKRKQQRRAEGLDATSACVILQSYLEFLGARKSEENKET
jgi:putative Holliday junction resolvase